MRSPIILQPESSHHCS